MEEGVPLKEFFEKLLEDRDRVKVEELGRIWDRFEANDRALEEQKKSLAEYKTTANEFRGSLNDQGQRFATRVEAGQALDRIDKLEKANDNMQGRLWALGAGIAIVVVVINVILRFLP